MAAAAGIVVLVLLALTLLWRVYIHHASADQFREEDTVVSISHLAA